MAQESDISSVGQIYDIMDVHFENVFYADPANVEMKCANPALGISQQTIFTAVNPAFSKELAVICPRTKRRNSVMMMAKSKV